MIETWKSRIPTLVLGLFVIQPLMDVLSFWLDKFAVSGTVTLVLRLAVLAATPLAHRSLC